jgi:hypothetical protein
MAAMALSSVACTTGQARTVLRAANNAIGELRDIPEVPPTDLEAMQVALHGVETSLEEPGRADFWVQAFMDTAVSVIATLEAHGISVPKWIVIAIHATGVFCQEVCALF